MGGKYTSAIAEVYLPPSESTLLRSQWLRHRVQLQRNVDEEGGKYTEAMAEVYLPTSESTLLRSPPSPHPPTVGLMISTPTASEQSQISEQRQSGDLDVQPPHHLGDLQFPPELFPVLPDTRPASCIFAHLDSVISSSNTLSTFLMCMFYLKKLLFHDSFSVCLLSILHIITTCKIWAF